jgi:hypothetical protein
MHQREVERRLDQCHAVAAADGLDPRHFLDHLGRRFRIVVEGAGPGSAGQDAGIVGTAENDADAARYAERQKCLQGFLFQQRVAAGQQEKIEIPLLGKKLRRLPLVDAGADGSDDTLFPERQQGPVAGTHELRQARVASFL